jgi:hypothetical protein
LTNDKLLLYNDDTIVPGGKVHEEGNVIP